MNRVEILGTNFCSNFLLPVVQLGLFPNSIFSEHKPAFRGRGRSKQFQEQLHLSTTCSNHGSISRVLSGTVAAGREPFRPFPARNGICFCRVVIRKCIGGGGIRSQLFSRGVVGCRNPCQVLPQCSSCGTTLMMRNIYVDHVHHDSAMMHHKQ